VDTAIRIDIFIPAGVHNIFPNTFELLKQHQAVLEDRHEAAPYPKLNREAVTSV
jgi:hypothetical protein